MMYYNFVRIHKTLKVTPAMAAGVTDKLWKISDVVAMLEKYEATDSVSSRAGADCLALSPRRPLIGRIVCSEKYSSA